MSLLDLIREPPKPPEKTVMMRAGYLIAEDRFRDPDTGEWFTVQEFRRSATNTELHVGGKRAVSFPLDKMVEVEKRW